MAKENKIDLRFTNSNIQQLKRWGKMENDRIKQ